MFNPIFLLFSVQQTKTSPTGGASAAANNPFLSSPTTTSGNIVDLFGPTAASAQPPNSKASDDLLQLGNPFADMFGSPAPAAQPLVGKHQNEPFFTQINQLNFLTFGFSSCTTNQRIRVRQ